jgi:chemotaxis-related protein WspD
MNDRRGVAEALPGASIHSCWATIGVRGDRSCPELREHVHCRNCPVYSASARQLLDAEPPTDELVKWTSHFAEPKQVKELDTQAIVIFRAATEWLALRAPCVAEVASVLPIHKLPHRPNAVILGLANVRGELVVCASLLHLLGLPQARTGQQALPTEKKRLLVIRHEQVRAVCPVDEVHGVHRFHPRELRDVPATVARTTTTYSRAVLPWRERSIGVLDEALLFAALKRSVA